MNNITQYFLDRNYLLVLYELLQVWQINDDEIFDVINIELPEYFLRSINEYNKQNTKQQMDTINNTIKIIDEKNQLSFLNKIIEKQICEAKNWCEKYKEKVNTKSNFIQEYREHKF